jgi:hypothetical protein
VVLLDYWKSRPNPIRIKPSTKPGPKRLNARDLPRRRKQSFLEPDLKMGLGLWQVYSIVSQHNKHIAVGSDANLGTTINIYLPPATQENKETSVRIPSPPRPGQDEVILVVEDEPIVLEASNGNDERLSLGQQGGRTSGTGHRSLV